MPEATFPPRNFSGLILCVSYIPVADSRARFELPHQEVEIYVKKNSFHFFLAFKGLIPASTMVPKCPQELGSEGTTCHFKSTTAKTALANSSWVLTCLLVLLCRWRTKEVCFNLLLLLFAWVFSPIAPSCWPWCSLSMHCHRDEQGSPPACSQGRDEECSKSGCCMASWE